MNLLVETLGRLLLIAALASVTGCGGQWLGDEVTPEQVGLEIIVKGDGSGPDACYVNVDELVAATHLVSVSAEHGTAHVRILDDADNVVFEADSVGTLEGSSGEGSADQPDMMLADDLGQHDVRLVPGDYRVECATGTSQSTASLRLTPAPSTPAASSHR